MNNDTLKRIEIAESLGWTHYASGHNATPTQKSAANWWNNADPAELVKLPTLAELSALANSGTQTCRTTGSAKPSL